MAIPVQVLGYFQDTTQSFSCTPCSTCASGNFIAVPCGNASDAECRNCKICGSGQYTSKACANDSDTVCKNCTKCGAGQYQIAPCTSVFNTVCGTCSTGCPEGKYVAALCNATADVVCIDCTRPPHALRFNCTSAGSSRALTCANGYAVVNGACSAVVNGTWSSWSPWTDCTATCGSGTKSQTRTCTPPKNGGLPCAGEKVNTAACQLQSCPVNGGWTSWGAWGSCAKAGASCIKRASRTCANPTPANGGQSCAGDSSKSADCNPSECGTNGGWTGWSVWTDCKLQGVTCVKHSSRTCTNPAPANGGLSCVGGSSKSADCDPSECGTNGGWTGWSVWTDCKLQGVTCVKHSSRTCTNPAPANGGAACAGASSKIQNCGSSECSTNVDGGWSAWQLDGSCSVTCGVGLQSYSRRCNNPMPAGNGKQCAGSASTKRSCARVPCQCTVGGWTAWGACSLPCGGGEQSRTRAVTVPGAQCNVALRHERSCNTATCDVIMDVNRNGKVTSFHDSNTKDITIDSTLPPNTTLYWSRSPSANTTEPNTSTITMPIVDLRRTVGSRATWRANSLPRGVTLYLGIIWPHTDVRIAANVRLVVTQPRPCRLPSTLFPHGITSRQCQAGSSLADGASCTVACSAGFIETSGTNVITCIQGLIVSRPTLKCTKKAPLFCTSPWGMLKLNTRQRVGCSPVYCRSVSSNNRRCSGMWASCDANGKLSVRCIY